MSKNTSTASRKANLPGYTFKRNIAGIEEYELKSNKLTVLYLHRPNTNVVTTNIVYRVGARDEARGETGVAHMLEHMLFKPTKSDLKKKITAGSAMHFERTTGAILNANTWKDRTTYYFSYPVNLFAEALQIEADRMEGVVLTDEALRPEQGNVLSEFDMYNGDPNFALSVQMCSTAYHSHPYGHETIGYREDIEDYTAEKLDRFYRNYYRPDNAVLMIIGDIEKKPALQEAKKAFESIKNPLSAIPRHQVREPKQEGTRRVSITRPTTTNLVSIGFKHAGFPSKDWLTTNVLANLLTSGPDSILQRLLIDTGRASDVQASIEPTSEENLGQISITLAAGEDHAEIEHLVLKAIAALDLKTINPLVKRVKAQMITSELFERDSSLAITQELTEYAAARQLDQYPETPNLLQSITAKQVLKSLKDSFTPNNLTIGHFIGKA